jgi:hypothetical protein
MKKSPIVTLLVGVLLAAIIVVLSVRAHRSGTTPRPTPTDTSTDQPYGYDVEVAWPR